jgi:hypothetical protein
MNARHELGVGFLLLAQSDRVMELPVPRGQETGTSTRAVNRVCFPFCSALAASAAPLHEASPELHFRLKRFRGQLCVGASLGRELHARFRISFPRPSGPCPHHEPLAAESEGNPDSCHKSTNNGSGMSL